MTTNQDKTIYVTENKQEFVPEVGQYCIGMSEGGVDFNCQILAVVIDGDEKVIVFRYEEGDLEAATESNRYSFRPLKTEAEIRRDSQIDSIYQVIVRIQNDPSLTSDQLYDEGLRLINDEFIDVEAKEKGYIKPRDVTLADILYRWEKLRESGFTERRVVSEIALFVEKHIKGEA